MNGFVAADLFSTRNGQFFFVVDHLHAADLPGTRRFLLSIVDAQGAFSAGDKSGGGTGSPRAQQLKLFIRIASSSSRDQLSIRLIGGMVVRRRTTAASFRSRPRTPWPFRTMRAVRPPRFKRCLQAPEPALFAGARQTSGGVEQPVKCRAMLFYNMLSRARPLLPAPLG